MQVEGKTHGVVTAVGEGVVMDPKFAVAVVQEISGVVSDILKWCAQLKLCTGQETRRVPAQGTD